MPFEKGSNTYTPCWQIGESDAWNADQTIAWFVGDMLNKLADIDHGHPDQYSPETWITQLRHHAKIFIEYGHDSDSRRDEIHYSLAFLSANFGHLWD